ncbi:tellurium resistance protein, partial [Vibrio alginolyticus]
WLHDFGFLELSIATVLVVWVSAGYVKMYWPEIMKSFSKQA